MSRETMQHLNTNTLIGMTDKRGNAWHYRADLQGAEGNHYPGAIPVADVKRRLFNWQALSVPVSVTVPATTETATTMDAVGNPVRVVPVPDRQAIMHSVTGEVFKVFKDSYRIHQYDEWLLGRVSNILGDTLAISSAGLLRGGAVAWVEISVPETIKTADGVEFRPNLLAATSLDGTIATTYTRTVTNTVCDNTMAVALGEAGQKIKIRHSVNSAFRLQDARAALNIVEDTAQVFQAQVEELCATKVTPAQWQKFLEEINPIDPEAKGVKATKAEAKRVELERLWRNDARVSPWQNTAWGVVQAVNTYAHHVATVKGDRGERNMAKTVQGKFEELDSTTMFLLNRVLVAAR